MLHQYTVSDVNAQPKLLKLWVIESAKAKVTEKQNNIQVKSNSNNDTYKKK